MPILTKEVEVRVNPYTVEHYKSLGYEIPMKKATKSSYKKYKKEFVYDFSKSIIVKVEDLLKNSETYLNVLCDICKEKILTVKYIDYNKTINKSGSYVCMDCAHIKRKQTNIAHYGDEYVRTKEFKEKRKKSCLDKYRVESPLQNKNIMEKLRSTNLEKYGCVNPSQFEEFKEKIRFTSLERYGVSNPSKSEEIKKKTRMTNLEKYGVPYIMQLPKVREKANETLCKNGTQKTSKQQLYLHSILGGKLNFPISYYAIDICFPEEKLALEYDGGFHDGRVKLGRLTQEEFNQKEIIRNNIIKREGYKQMRIISSKDRLSQDDILLQMLQDAKQYFSDYPNHSWIEFSIDTSTVRNAEHKEGVPYDFGELRTIKDKDIENIKEDLTEIA